MADSLPAVVASDIGYSVEHWTVEDGLPERGVTCLAQTPDGYLWCGTYSGLARYDGQEFKLFDAQNTTALDGVRIHELHCDGQGRLWIAGASGELVVHESGSFRRLDEGNGFPQGEAGKLGGDPQGDFWFKGRTDGRFYRYRNGRFATERAGISGTNVDRFVADARGLVWAIHEQERTMIPLSEDAYMARLPELDGQQDNTLGRFFYLEDGRLAVTSSRAIYAYGDGGWDLYRRLDPAIPHQACNGVEDWEGNLWVSYVGVGLVCHPKDGASVRVGLPDVSDSPYLPAVKIGLEGNIWVCGGSGLYRLRRNSFISQPGIEATEGRPAAAVVEDGKGSIWLIYQHGIAQKQDANWRFFPNPDLDTSIWTGAPSQGGGIFLGSANSGRGEAYLEQINPDGSRTRLATFHANIRCILESDADKLWVGTETALWHGQHGVFRHEVIPMAPGENDIYALAQDDQGRIIASAFHQGLFRRERDGSWHRIGATNDLGNRLVVAIFPDREVLWVGTDRGLVRWKQDQWHAFGGQNGALPGWVRGVTSDDLGGLWITSQFGVTRAEKSHLNAAADAKSGVSTGPALNSAWFDRADGLPSVTCVVGDRTACRDSEGKIWVATAKGAAVANPPVWKTRADRMVEPPVYLESVLADDQELLPSGTSFEEKPIRLPAGTTRIELTYSVVNLTANRKSRFRYRMENYDENWVSAGANRTAVYHYLPPGKHRFQVTAISKTGTWNEHGAAIGLLVQPYWWQRSWVQFVGVAGFLATGLGIYLARVQQLKRKAAAREAFAQQLIATQEAERKRLAAELHDDLGQDLLVIKSRLDMHGTGMAPGQPMTELAGSVKQCIHKLRQISHGLRPLQLERLGLSACIRAMVVEVTQATQMHIKSEVDELHGVLAADVEIALYRILQEALNNVVKHSDASETQVILKRLPDRVILSIVDDGRGFPAEDRARGPAEFGHGLLGMEERCRLIDAAFAVTSVPGAGTTIRVEILILRKNQAETASAT